MRYIIKITFDNIKTFTAISPSDITPTKRKEGRIKAGTVINNFLQGDQIDVLLVKDQPIFICDTRIEFDENDIRARKTFTKIERSQIDEKRLNVKTQFFRNMEITDTIYLILTYRQKV